MTDVMSISFLMLSLSDDRVSILIRRIWVHKGKPYFCTIITTEWFVDPPPLTTNFERSMYARVCVPQAMAQFVLKIEKLSHVIGTAPIVELACAYGRSTARSILTRLDIKGARSRYFWQFCLILPIKSSKRQFVRPRVFHLQNHGHTTPENDFPAVLITFWYMYKLTYRKFEKRWADVFQIFPNAIHFNPLQFCRSTSLLGFPVFC